MIHRILFFVLFVQVLSSSNSWAQQKSLYEKPIRLTLSAAGENRAELQKAIDSIEPKMKPGMEYLLAYMPPSDANELKAEFLVEHVRGAYTAWRGTPWKSNANKGKFLNYILPYANVTEQREQWRTDFRKRFLPLVQSAKSASEAAVILNQQIFSKLDVKYSTKRKRADQGPYESIEGGTASCTGLSILLIDACRSVGIPARFVGTPRWSDNSGNHSWVEIWDGEWKFTGAAEPTGDDLNKGWFTDRAAKAVEDETAYAIYAVSYRKTELKFPMVWKRSADPVWAINVTSRYASTEKAAGENQVVNRFKVIDSNRSRVVAELAILDSNGKTLFEGKTKDESFDSNDHVNVVLPKNSSLVAKFRVGSGSVTEKSFETKDETELVVLLWEENKSESSDGADLSREQADDIADELYASRQIEVAKSTREMLSSKVLRVRAFPGLEMKYDFKTFGDKPAAGHALYISMHGGGNAPTRLNDRQWKNQIGLYEPAEGIYLAPRAPTDSWNLWHQNHIDAFFDKIIASFVAAGDVNPNRVYLMGYSAGGDGVYQLAPRMADRFAAASMMAGHPNETKPLGLRNLPFAIFMGGKDAAYDRNKIAAQWKEKLAALKTSDPNGYDHQVTIYPEKGHWMDREDASVLPWLAEKNRNPWPKKIVWHQDDVTHDRFYWLSVPAGKAKERTTVVASVEGQKITIESADVDSVRIWISNKLLDLNEEIEIVVNGKSQTHTAKRTKNALVASLDSRFDRAMMASAFIDVKVN